MLLEGQGLPERMFYTLKHKVVLFLIHALVVKWHNKSMVRINRQFDSVLEHQLFYSGQVQCAEYAYVHPTYVKLPPVPTESSTGWIQVMIVVQFFATNHNTPRTDVSTEVASLAISVSNPMSDAINNTCGPEWNPYHLNTPYYGAHPTE